MKKKDLTGLKNKTVPELTKQILDLETKIGAAQMDLSSHKAKNTNFAKNLKRELAILLSIKKEKEIYVSA